MRLTENPLQRLCNFSDHLFRFRRVCGHRQAVPELARAWLLANDCTSRRPELVDRTANFSLSDGNGIARAFPTGIESGVSTPEQKCIGLPEQKYISDGGKKAPELGAPS
jgi:hypothetical protein